MTLSNVSRYVVGKVFVEKGFLSATEGGILFPGRVYFDILSRHGRKAYLLNPTEENEVLFAPGTRFKVLKKEKDENGDWHIQMNEL